MMACSNTCLEARSQIHWPRQSTRPCQPCFAGSALDEYYDFRATVPGDKSWNSSTIAPMMKQFLIESFHLAVHSGARELSGYALVVGKSGSKLKATQADPTVQGQKAGESTANFTAPVTCRVAA
jgi:uncharacterized protein (TIGR03435 family)